MRGLLEGGDGAGDLIKCGVEMSKNLGGGGSAGGRVRTDGWRTATQQCRADPALGEVEPLPDPLPGPVAPLAMPTADGRGNASADSELQEPPQRAGGQARPSEFAGDPDAESPPAPRSPMAVAAEDPPGAEGFSLRAAVVESEEDAMPIERADGHAVRAGSLFEPLADHDPLGIRAVEKSLLTHGRRGL